jgi:3-deoxy-manno-octulosonate cytidylyltransferase (CMP-KDO synthetase)
MNIVGIIPARYDSTRLPGKPLIDINGKPMIQHVYEKAAQLLPQVVVATDDDRIAAAVVQFGGQFVMTDRTHHNGTSRCLEALQRLNQSAAAQGNPLIDVVINIQGDEPMLLPQHIQDLVRCYENSTPDMATLVLPVRNPEELQNESEVFVVFDKNHKALYFSRYPIPYLKGVKDPAEKIKQHTYYKHLGVYAYTRAALQQFSELPVSHLEKTESLEQNRWLESGGTIQIAITSGETIPVDTLEDAEKVRKLLK